MTGGISNEENSKAGRWDDKEVEKLKEEREKLETERAQLDDFDGGYTVGGKSRRSSRDGFSSRIEELRSNVGTLRNKLQYSQTELEYSKKRIKEQQALVGSLEKHIEVARANLNEAETDVAVAEDAVAKAGKSVKDVEEEFFAPFREKTGLSDFRAYDQAMGNARVEYQKKRRTILQHLEKLKAQKEYEDRRDFQALIAGKEKALSARKNQLETAREKEADILSVLAGTKDKLSEAENLLEEANELEKKEEHILKRCQNDYKEIQSESASLNKQINSIQSDLERLRAKLHETFVKARVEEAEIPLCKSSPPLVKQDRDKKRRRSVTAVVEDDSDNEDNETLTKEDSLEFSQSVTQDSAKTIHFSQADDSRVKKNEMKAALIDFSEMNEELKERRSDHDQNKIHKHFEDQLSSISSQLESISPNMKVSIKFSVPLFFIR
jgi:chromosome segregation ATPase